MADEAVAQSVDHVEEGIEMGDDLGESAQYLDADSPCQRAFSKQIAIDRNRLRDPFNRVILLLSF